MRDCVLIPVYNESATVSSVLDAVRGHFSGEVIVVDDGSTDSTGHVLTTRDDVTVVRLDRNCGYGCALRIGFDVAREMGLDRVVTMDCDGQHEPAHIPEFLEALTPEHDIISGSRYLPRSAVIGSAPSERQQINAEITAMVNSATGWSLTDSFCGFKAYWVSVLSRLTLHERGYGMPIELWAKAWRLGMRVSEIAVERIYCDHGRSFGDGLDDADSRRAYYLNVWQSALEDPL